MSCAIIDKRITAFVDAIYKRKENLYPFNECGEVAVTMFELLSALCCRFNVNSTKVFFSTVSDAVCIEE